jgi:hypothetical protein
VSQDQRTEGEQMLSAAFRRGEWFDAGGAPVRAEMLTALFTGADGPSALRLSSARITGSFNLEGRDVRQVIDLRDCVFEQTVDLRMAKLVGLRMRECGMPGMLARNVRVDSDVHLEPGFRCDGTLDLTDATVGGSLRMYGAVLHPETGLALAGARLKVHGSMLPIDLRATGGIRLAGAYVGGSLQLSGAHLTAPLDCDRIRVEGTIAMDKGFTAIGPVLLADARVGGHLRLAGATLGDPDAVDTTRAAVALFADGIELGGDLDARSGEIAGRPEASPLVAYGQVRFPGGRVNGSASLSGARLHSPGRDVLFADRLSVGETFFLEGVLATGSIRLQDTKIGASLNCTGSTFTEPRRRADGSRKPSLDLQFASIGHNLLCSINIIATGGVSARLAEIRHTVHMSFATIGDGRPDSVAFDGYGLVAHRLVLRFPPNAPPKGGVRLAAAHVRVLSDGPGLWIATGGVDVADFVYESVESYPHITVKHRLRWLREVQPDFAPGPYDQLVAVYRDAGEEQMAEEVLLEKQRRRHAELGTAGRVWGALQERTVGYGYRPWLAAVWLGVFWLAGTLWFAFHPMSKLDNDQNPVWNPPLLAMDLLLPIIDLGQDNMWQMVGPSQWISNALIALGWVLATTIAAGGTRLLKRG